MRKFAALTITVFALVFLLGGGAFAFDLTNPLFHDGVTAGGHTGLLLTKSAESLPAGRFAVSLAPDFYDRDLAGGASEKLITVPLAFAYGLPYNVEVAGKITYLSKDNGTSESDVGEAGLSLKWNFLQQEGGDYPSMAVGLGGNYAIADEKKGLTQQRDFNLIFFVAGSALVDLGPYDDYAFSLYGEGDIVLNDWGKDYEEKHGEYSVGILLPVPHYTSVGFIVEFGGTVNKGWNRDDDVVRITPGLRVSYRNAMFTLGASFVNPEASGEDSFVDYTLQVSALF
ncbi:MAG: hypothetical protein D6713_01875 [Deltaproteobacteria bacterium]|nr:MAG: hypothetical protein D6713_01875 [Deltaproteobacteria bacterium]